MQLEWIDVAIVGLIALSVLTGLFRGLVKEVIAVCVWIIATWLAYHYSESLSMLLISRIHDKTMRIGVAFALIFFATVLIGSTINAILSFIMKRSGLSGTDRTLGMGFGFLRGIFIVALIILTLRMTSLPYQQYTGQSLLYGQFEPVVSWLQAHLPQFITQVKGLELTENNLDKVPLSLNLKKISPAKDTTAEIKS